MAPRVHRQRPFPVPTALDAIAVAKTRPGVSSEARREELDAQIAELSRMIESLAGRGERRKRRQERAEWYRAACLARTNLRRQRAELEARGADQRRLQELSRQEHDRATRQARNVARESGRAALWDCYLRAEVALLTIAHNGGDIGPLGDSVVRSAEAAVPDWYREHWMATVYGTTWGREAERARRRPAATEALAPPAPPSPPGGEGTDHRDG